MSPDAESRRRADAMVRRVLRAADRATGDERAALLVATAVRLGIRARFRRPDAGDRFDPLHPGRTALILIEDARIADPTTLAAAAVCETLHPVAAAPDPLVRRALGPEVARLRAEVPVPACVGDGLLDALLAAGPAARIVAVAERLDHARHLHLRDRAAWAGFLDETRDAYLPVAGTTHPALERRMRWWCDTFERRFLPAGG